MERRMRPSGIDCVGDIPWGTHLCQFYESKQDLIDILVSYFRSGLENNESCMWITSEPLAVSKALAAAREGIPNFDQYLQRGQIAIIPHFEWYLRDGTFDSRRVLNGWVEHHRQALARGYTGLRVTGNTFWLETERWSEFLTYEEQIDDTIGNLQMIALCSYFLPHCQGSDVLDVIRTHRFAVIKRQDRWDLVESTELRRARNALHESEEHFRTERQRVEDQLLRLSRAVEQSSATVVITDTRGNIEYVNPRFTQLTGYTPDEVIGHNPRILKSGEMSENEYAKLWKTISSGDEWRGEFHNRKKNGELYWESASISPIRNPEGEITHFLAIKDDITERKQAQEEIEKLNTDLTRRAVELDAINRELEAFSYSVSHDLRAPLRSIDGFSQALQEEFGDRLDEMGVHYLQRVRGASQRMAQLIDDLLTLSRVTRSEMRCEEVDLTELAQGITTELQKTQPNRRVEFVIEPGVTALGDSRLLGTVLENLLGNSWKFTGGHSQARIEFGTTETGGELAYFVRDDGAGFDMAYIDKLFGVFQRLHTQVEFPGTGIGLASVQRIIHRHGGRVWAEGEVERGATFYFTLPLS